MSARKNELTKAEALDFYKKMVLTRKTEAKHDELFQRQVIPVYTHLSLGQEATGCGVTTLLRDDDYLLGTHRGLAEYVGKGMEVVDILLEYGERANSPSGGRAGLHLMDPKRHILGAPGSLGSDFSLAVGVGLALKQGKTDAVVVDYFGEGAAEQGDFHPGMNMAMLYKVPVVFCCATNQFVEYHPYRESTCTEDIAPRAEGYGMPWEIVGDGNDLFSVGGAMKRAIKHCRQDKGPCFLEFKTYRLAPHHTGDQCLYRKKEDMEEAKKNDPLLKARNALLKCKWATRQTLDRVDRECDELIEDAVSTLVESPLPDPRTVLDHLFAG